MGRDDVCLALVGGRDVGAVAAASLAQRWPRRVVRLPRFGADEMPGVVAAADVVVVPQRDTEVARAQFPIKLTDAMAMAKPIVTTAVGDIAEVVGDGGWVVAPGDAGALRRALEEALDDPAGARLRGQRARERCVAHYSVGAAAARLRPVLQLD
jgi:glycosyltransferase involved in cell wall biosynthesis